MGAQTHERSIRTDYRRDLTAALPELAAPFAVAAIRFKPQTKPNAQGKSLVTFYMDARMVIDRLNHVVGAGAWQDEYRLVYESTPQAHITAYFPVECALTVLGVTKRDVGVYQRNQPDDKALKSGYSDALKRAAVKFGVGGYLYKLPNVWEEVVVGADGKAKGFTIQAQQRLRAGYEKWLGSQANVFGAALDHGDPLPELVDPDAPATVDPAAVEPAPDVEFASEHEVAKLLDLAARISQQARGWVDGTVKKHRESTGGRVTRKFLEQGMALVNEKLAAQASSSGSGTFSPPASVQAELASREGETTASDVERAFAA